MAASEAAGLAECTERAADFVEEEEVDGAAASLLTGAAAGLGACMSDPSSDCRGGSVARTDSIAETIDLTEATAGSTPSAGAVLEAADFAADGVACDLADPARDSTDSTMERTDFATGTASPIAEAADFIVEMESVESLRRWPEPAVSAMLISATAASEMAASASAGGGEATTTTAEATASSGARTWGAATPTRGLAATPRRGLLPSASGGVAPADGALSEPLLALDDPLPCEPARRALPCLFGAMLCDAQGLLPVLPRRSRRRS